MPLPSRVPVLEQLIDSLERTDRLDRLADGLDALWTKVLRRPVVTDVLSGKPLGHPLHPAAVLLPAGSLLSATLLDVVGGQERDVRRLTALGLASAVPAALAGWSDWLDTEKAEKRVGLVHAAVNVSALTAYAVGWKRSSRGARIVGAGLFGVGGWLGGHLVFARGVGVDTTAFQVAPAGWTDVADAAAVGEDLFKVDLEGLSVLLTRVNGDLVALAERCTHRGAPLSEGERQGDCVVCPWHQSVFDLHSGTVREGPATRPQMSFEVRERAGRVEVRRSDAGSLRTNVTP
jgi:nitrite reductase/ring-hydroxylating ferredoxin subunit/uncharacterized membrane protein